MDDTEKRFPAAPWALPAPPHGRV